MAAIILTFAAKRFLEPRRTMHSPLTQRAGTKDEGSKEAANVPLACRCTTLANEVMSRLRLDCELHVLEEL
jgi:hypothetical protein